ncbi:MAG: S9 family peptidase [Planctomycetia bacterium]|nr:S9 family peptidase [Planctomycetia bacterium]
MPRLSCCFAALVISLPGFVGCGSKSAPAPEEVSATPAKTAASKSPRAGAPAIEPTSQQSDRADLAATAGVELIGRKILFGNPDKASARLSPDGSKLSYLAPRDGVLNVFVGPVDDPNAAQPVTKDDYRGIQTYFWAYDSRHILYAQDTGGDEDFHVYSVDLTTNQAKDLTPLAKVSAQIEEVSEKFPEEILVGLNDRDPQFHDVYRINIATGERTLIQKNTEFASITSDDEYRVRFAMKMTLDGGSQLYQADGQGGWKEFQKIDFDDTLTTSPTGFDKTGQILYMTDSRGRDTGALTQIDLASGTETVLAANDLADVGGALAHPTEKNIQAVSFDYERPKWQVLDPAIADDMSYLEKLADGELQVPSRTLDDKTWIAAYIQDDGPVRYYLYDRAKKEARFLFTNRSSLEGQPLAKMHPLVIESRDGLKLVSYLTLPKSADPAHSGRPKEPLPMVLVVHGGPWGRDTWGYDSEHQLLANRGYAVLSVNYRGSTSFGKKFANAGNKEWAAKMHDDLIDAVDWAIHERVADPKRVAIMGGSYGGYATLVGLTFTPEKFACGVDIVGPSNLLTLLNTIPAYWAPALQMFKDRVGDPTTAEGKKLVNERSPLNLVERIQRPLLIGQGANDPRVKQSEADQIVQAMEKKHIPVTYLLFPDEGHGFARPENNLAFNAAAEAFLARQLEGRYEPIGNDFAGSTITSPSGAEGVPGLAAALEKHALENPTDRRNP